MINFLSAVFTALGSLMLIVPALRADRYLSSAQLAKGAARHAAYDTARNAAQSAVQGTPDKMNATASDIHQHGNLVNALDQLSNQLTNNARQWTPTMSYMLRGGIFFTLFGGILRILGTWPVHG